MSSDFKNKAFGGAKWTLIESIGLRGFQFVIGVILARLLLPEQFGLIAMITIFIAVSQTFIDSGFGAALIQKKTIIEADTSSLFYFNIFIGIIATGVLCGVAPWIADFYNQPILISILRLMSLTLIINSSSLVQNFLLRKYFNFKTEAYITIVTGLLSGFLAVIMAYKGFGVWALVYQQISGSIIRTMLLWRFSPWHPSWLFSLKSLREMFSFSSKLLLSDLLNKLFENIYSIVIGKLFSPTDLGYFTRADNLQKLPSKTLSSMTSRVVFPLFSSIQEDRVLIKRGMQKVLTTLVMINFPLMIGLMVVARPLVLVLFTDKWIECVPYFQVLCLVGLLHPLHGINLNVLSALGRSDLFLRLEIITKILVVLNIAITWQWGIMALVWGQVLVSFLSYFVNAYYTKKLLGYSIWEQMRDLYPYLMSSLLMAGSMYFIEYIQIDNQGILLFFQLITGSSVYLLLCKIFRFPAYLALWEMILSRWPTKTKP